MAITKRPTRYFSSKQEKAVQKELGLAATANSGATVFDPGDAKDPFLLAEMKTMMKPQVTATLRKEWFDKIEEERFARGRTFGIIVFDFGTQKAGEQYVALPASDFKQLYEAWQREVTNDG